MSLQSLRNKPRRPFWKLPQHRLPVLSLYKSLLKISKSFPDELHQKYLFYHIRQKFRLRRHETSITKTIEYLSEAQECKSTIIKALNGDTEAFQHIDDLTWGRKGRLKEVLDILENWKKPKLHKFVKDTRTYGNRARDPHPAYRIPLDKRLYTPPEYKEPIKIFPKKKHPFRPNLRKYTVITQLGYKLWRVRGWKQPTWISLMMNKRIKAHQRRIDRYHQLEEQLEMVRLEQRILRMLDPTLVLEEKEFEKRILSELGESKKYHDRILKMQAKKEELDEADI
ncbi:273_t:CDS:2 [Funneliformis mosseae]|uniref:273_t:CDS:1 n=1 Tax=Funneliformis mosseae TaxID=27381 RepID=A0A9N9FZ60_FUNMO|nr:273_t:CDS:2 [Funneliformis mosseae]